MRTVHLLFLVALFWPIALAAQTAAKPAAPSRPPAAAPKPATPATPPPPTETYTYDPGGRRDPFMNLLATGSEPGVPTRRGGEGPAGLTVAEISVRGVMQSRTGLIAMVEAPDKKTYLIHQGDKFADGVVKSVTNQGLVIVQEVNDPLSLVKQREIRKVLRSAEGAKP